MRILRLFSLAGAVLLVLAGCGDSGDSTSSSLAVTQNADVAELLGTPVSDEDVLAGFESVHTRSEELIAACMAAAGFDYVPAPFQPEAAQALSETETSIGITDQYFGAFRDDFEPSPPDPNDAAFQALSEDEQAAYNQALLGASPVFDPRLETEDAIREGLVTGAVNQTGCRVVSQQSALAETDRNEQLIDEYSMLRAGLLQTDQGLFRARVDWAICMAEAGFTYRDEAAMREDVNGQALSVLQDLVELRDQGVEMTPGQAPPPEAAELIDALREREAEVAAAHAVCREPVDAAIAEVRDQADEIFLDRNS